MVWLLSMGAVLATSLLSGVLGMGGGMILMGVFALLMPIPTAMVLHGVTQAAANGSRAWIHRQHIQFEVLGFYVLGSLLVLLGFFWLVITVEKSWFFVFLGSLALLSLVTPKSLQLDVTRPVTAFVCGIAVTLCQLLVGVSGSVLDIFYLNSPLNRFQVVATKAFTQTLGHLFKLIFFGWLLWTDPQAMGAPWWMFVAVVALATSGSKIGAWVLHRMNDQAFRYWSKWIIGVIGCLYLYKGVAILW